MIVIEKDRHFRLKKPFDVAFKEYHEWFIAQPWNVPGNTYISLGDWFDVSHPSPEEYLSALNQIKDWKFDQIIILGGNHDYSRRTKQNSGAPLLKDPRVKYIVDSHEKLTLEGLNFWFLPFYYKASTDQPAMQELYSTLKGICDYVLYHFEDETIDFGKHTGIDLTGITGKRIGGHVHHKLAPNYNLGMPVHHRKDEAGQPTELLVISDQGEQFYPVPNFLDYETLKWGEESKCTAKTVMLTVTAVPPEVSQEEIALKYPRAFIKEVVRVGKEAGVFVPKVAAKRKTLLDYVNDFCMEKAVPETISNQMRVYLNLGEGRGRAV